MPAEVENMFSARQTPWHRIGTVTPDVLTAKDALAVAGLDWKVEKRPLFRKVSGTDDQYEMIPNRFELVRDSDERLMTIVSDVYKPFQNEDAFTFTDNLVDDGSAKYETAGSLRHGAVVFLSMHVPMDLMVAGEDRHEAYIILRTTHDGSGRVSVYVSMIRVVCTNTMNMAIDTATQSWGITHTADVAGKIQKARDSLGLTFKYAEQFKATAESLIDVKVTDDEIVALLEGVVPSRSRRDEEIEAIVTNHRTSDTIANYRNTGWGMLNAFTEYTEHMKDNRSGQAAFSRIIDGPQSKARTVLSNRLLARV